MKILSEKDNLTLIE